MNENRAGRRSRLTDVLFAIERRERQVCPKNVLLVVVLVIAAVTPDEGVAAVKLSFGACGRLGKRRSRRTASMSFSVMDCVPACIGNRRLVFL